MEDFSMRGFTFLPSVIFLKETDECGADLAQCSNSLSFTVAETENIISSVNNDVNNLFIKYDFDYAFGD